MEISDNYVLKECILIIDDYIKKLNIMDSSVMDCKEVVNYLMNDELISFTCSVKCYYLSKFHLLFCCFIGTYLLLLWCSIKNKFFYKMKYSEFYKLIEAAGWTISWGKKHHKYVHPDFDYFIPVGRHPSKEIPKGTLLSMMKDAGLKK